jgi:carboxypeptidase C (cathepsin A)
MADEKAEPKEPKEAKDQKEPKKPEPFVDEEPVVTRHEAAIRGKKRTYTVTAGRMPLRNAENEIEAQVFYISYALDEPGPGRPLMFSFNGGPGSPALWLHLGALGPKRVSMDPQGEMPKPPFRLLDNQHTWLEETDLVFIDPVGTGYSRAHTKELGEKFWSLNGDIESVGEFIRLYLTRFERWSSPLYLVGESYGTTRAAGLAGHLVNKGIAFSGIVLVSSILNFQTTMFTKGNDLPYKLFLPAYTATAWYHRCLDGALQRDLAATLKEVEAWAMDGYSVALDKGDKLTPRQALRVARKLARYTGLSREYVEQANLRVKIHAFCKELLRKQRRTVGRLDSRFRGIDLDQTAQAYEHDPSMSALMPPFTSMFNQHVRTELGYKTDLEYQIFGGILSPWKYGEAREGAPDTAEALRAALSKNPHMRVYVASGYYDLATPYFATEYTLSHMGLDPTLRANIETGAYEAGHMMYIHEPSLAKLKKAMAKFVR